MEENLPKGIALTMSSIVLLVVSIIIVIKDAKKLKYIRQLKKSGMIEKDIIKNLAISDGFALNASVGISKYLYLLGYAFSPFYRFIMRCLMVYLFLVVTWAIWTMIDFALTGPWGEQLSATDAVIFGIFMLLFFGGVFVIVPMIIIATFSYQKKIGLKGIKYIHQIP